MKSGDRYIEWFLTEVIGCRWELTDVPVKSIRARDTNQFSRTIVRDENYVSGIKETHRLGGPVRPLIVAKRSKASYVLLDGYHRLAAMKDIDSISAYVTLDATPEQEQFIASTANVTLNGQGLSEAERRIHYIEHLRTIAGEIEPSVIRLDLAKRLAHVLSISQVTAKRWVDVEVFKGRAAKLGLRLPPLNTGQKEKGDRGDAWVMAMAELTDEELVEYWPHLVGGSTQQIQKAARRLNQITSSRKRQEEAKTLLTLVPNLRVMSQSMADRERRMAGQIRVHGASLVKLAPHFQMLATKYEDVRNVLSLLSTALLEFETAPTEKPHGAVSA